LICEQTKTNLL